MEDLYNKVERMRSALQQVVRFADANGMQDWKMTKVARNALKDEQKLDGPK